MSKAKDMQAAILTIATQAEAALRAGIKAQGHLAVEAATSVTFESADKANLIESVKNMTNAGWCDAALKSGNVEEAVRMKIAIDRADTATTGTAADQLATYVFTLSGACAGKVREGVRQNMSHVDGRLPHVDRYLGIEGKKVDATRFAERDVLNVTVDQPPFTNLEPNVTPFQARLLDQAAVDNFDAVQKFLSSPSTVTVDQLHELFTSCFMHEGLRDELFIAIHKASTDPIRTNDQACLMLQLALGHFGPSKDLHAFVKALVQDTGADWKLRELLIRREYVMLTQVCMYIHEPVHVCSTSFYLPRQTAVHNK